MAGRKMQYLVRRGNTYSFRRGIPARIQHIIDKGTHYVVSLGTADVSAAKRECLRIAAEVQSEFDRAFSQLPKPVAKVAAVDKALDVPGAVALVSDIIADRQHRDFHAALDNPAKAARFARVRRALAAELPEPDGDDSLARLFARNLANRGHAVAPQSPAFKVGLAKFRKSLLESLDHAAAWAAGEFDYLPDEVITPKPMPTVAAAAKTVMTVTKLAAAYADERGISGRGRDELMALIRWLTEVIGGDLAASDVTSEHIYAFKSLFKQKPARLQKRIDSELTLPQLVSAYEGKNVTRVTQKTVAKHIGNLHAVFGWARRNRIVKENIVEGMVPPKSKKKIGGRPDRLPFTKEDVELIFQAPLFKGVNSPADRHQHIAGDYLIDDHRFWLPILALFTGCRLEEMGQADAADVKQDEGIWYFNVTTLLDDEDYANDDKLKGLKTGTSTRIVPLHPQLIELGFAEYVDSVKGGKLFPLLTPDRYGCWTASYSKRFGRWLNRTGVTSDLKVFHSFRHAFKDACRAAKIPHEVHQRLTGHAMASVGDKYGLGVSLQDAAEYVAQIKYPTFVPPPKRGAVRGAMGDGAKSAKAEELRVPREAKRNPRRLAGHDRSSGGMAASG